MSLVKSFNTEFHATHWKMGRGNTRHSYKASQALVGMLHRSWNFYRGGRVYKVEFRNNLGKCHLNVNLKLRHRHVCSVHYQHHWSGTMSKEFFTKKGKETIYPTPREIPVIGIYVAQLDLKWSKPALHSLNTGRRP